jgi:hypothetical protein
MLEQMVRVYVRVHVVTTVLHSHTQLPFIPQSFCECREDKACTIVFPGIDFHEVSISAAGGGGGAEKITGARLYFTYSCLPLQYHYLSIVHINRFGERPRHSTAESQSCRFSIKVLNRSAIAAGSEKNFS